ncbi:uncharacterized protein I303_100582 [Kwoniella dejecticola CBS 10117]|uniref:Rab-GAP TBC domain-containing protein n=1 Tax=Kwoniella dejecticola CBS 10117 TaxID=1296121 RepID=A0AAJ8KGX6_9TREE
MTDVVTEEAVFPRPTATEIRSKWKALFSDPLLSPSRLKAIALTKNGLGDSAADGGVILRSVYWRFYHNLLPPPTSPSLFSAAVAASREAYNSLRRRYLIAPDERWASDCTGAEDHHSPSASSTSASASTSRSAASPIPGSSRSKGEGWDPLSLDSSSPWKTWFAHVDLRSTISQDVERTFPDIPYFQLPRVRKSLVTSLFLFSVLNPDVGYRQGMHELLACCFLAVDRDSLSKEEQLKTSPEKDNEAMWDTLDRKYVEHDSFQLFQAIMKGAKEFYEWRAEEGLIKTRTPNAPQAPIITRCNNIHTSLLRRIDPQLWERLETEGVEAQIWAIRWIRLIFTREIPFSSAMRIWDGIFAEDPGLGIMDFICVAMLLLIRNELIEADYPTLLTQLLHYPSPSPLYPFEPSLILSQALFLRDNISPTAGVEVVLQNQDILGVKVTPSDRSAETDSGRQPIKSSGDLSAGGAGRGSRGRAGMGGLAQGLFERAQAAGLDKAFMTTVADLRRNLPDSATAYSYLPNLPFSPGSPARENSSFSSIPSSSAALPRSFLTSQSATYFQPQPPPQAQTQVQTQLPNPTKPAPATARPNIGSRPSVDSIAPEQSLKDAELEMAELRLAMVGMGKAMSEWLSIIHSSSGQEAGEAEKENAWKGLERVKDGLLDAAGKETEQIVKEWGWGLETSSSRAGTPAPDPLPETHGINPPELSIEAVPQPIEQGTLEFEDTTPTLPTYAKMPTQPPLPSLKPSIPDAVAPKSHDAMTGYSDSSRPHDRANGLSSSKSFKPNLTLSSSRSTPSAGLPRTPPVPSTAPLPPRPQSATLNRANLNVSDSYSDANQKMARRSIDNVKVDADPLAGLGVTHRDTDGLKKDRRSGGTNGVDPLLGVGVR